MATLANVLDELTIEGTLVEKMEDGTVRCQACAHRCVIKPGGRGICKVRFNLEGELRVPWGYASGIQADPIEKKPFFHLFPGSSALTFGMLGCDFHCEFCQNWVSSQALCDPSANFPPEYIKRIKPEEVVRLAKRSGSQVIVSSYNEPLITSEWAVDIFKLAKEEGIKCAYVSNGHATPEVLDFLRPYLSAYKIDLKSMQAKNYRAMGGTLKYVLDTIRRAHEIGLWVEVVTLVIPEFNDSPEELFEAARFLASVSADIPWHVTAFHPDYKMQDRGGTSAAILQQAAEIGQEAGLRYVYAGNLPGRVGSLEDTFCPHCQARLVRRSGFSVLDYAISAEGACNKCGTKIAGVWSDDPTHVLRGGLGMPRRVI
jgi:pyruvate formate lyase activating enzyme